MKAFIKKSVVNGVIEVPGSKSHTIRAVAVASVADGISFIRSPLISEDAISSIGAARRLGAVIDMKKDVWTVQGTGARFKKPSEIMDMGNSGTSLRIFSALAALGDFEVSFDGDSSLRTRLMGPLLSALEKLGAKTSSREGKCPLSLKGPIKGGKTEVEGKTSQFVTALLFACPLCPADTEIKVFNLNEKPYVEITLDWLDKQNIAYEMSSDMLCFKIKGGQKYKPFDLTIPADFSTATFPLVAAAVTGGAVDIRNLDFNDRQGDKAVFSFMEKMGMTVKHEGKLTSVSRSGALKGAGLDLNDTPDALPALAVAAAYAEGRTVLGNAPQARIKETDRIACMCSELKKMGADIEELPDGLVINGGRPLHGAEVESYGDHRIAMALSIAGMGASGETIVNEAQSASVTYPDFYEDFKKLGADFVTA